MAKSMTAKVVWFYFEKLRGSYIKNWYLITAEKLPPFLLRMRNTGHLSVEQILVIFGDILDSLMF